MASTIDQANSADSLSSPTASGPSVEFIATVKPGIPGHGSLSRGKRPDWKQGACLRTCVKTQSRSIDQDDLHPEFRISWTAVPRRTREQCPIVWGQLTGPLGRAYGS
ncbi:hypothetical protein I302_105397 [Kwoniella bestiolae CBS 10118]|uniref:Uncharacterized protein n=1 Tax=Kwoniella bestiolae CBS 10118 TaxID=1296100 RepID=A0A1B9FT04_9TREE|nr:hypothetical protein I302_08678 [Kwoniella bestiolae CBS 10118]OCF21899.1 hypothetical protein I302_08678 [Kwoniella bestiolae CBS 10118]